MAAERQRECADDHDEQLQHASIVAGVDAKINTDEFWRASRRRAVPHVQSSDARPDPTTLRQLGPRPVVSVQPMATESSDPGGAGNQDGPVRAAFASIVERLIGTIRRDCLDRTLFWTTADLEMKLLDFQRYYNGHRTHAGLAGRTPAPSADPGRVRATVSSYRWPVHCRGLDQTPIAA